MPLIPHHVLPLLEHPRSLTQSNIVYRTSACTAAHPPRFGVGEMPPIPPKSPLPGHCTALGRQRVNLGVMLLPEQLRFSPQFLALLSNVAAELIRNMNLGNAGQYFFHPNQTVGRGCFPGLYQFMRKTHSPAARMSS